MTITNLFLGLTVGYTLLEELPVVGVTFFVPIAVAYLARLRPRSTPRTRLRDEAAAYEAARSSGG